MIFSTPAARSLQIVITSGQSLSLGGSNDPQLISSDSSEEKVLTLDFGDPLKLRFGWLSSEVNVSEFRGFTALEDRWSVASGMMNALKSSYNSAGMNSPTLLHINTGAGAKSIFQLMTSSKDIYTSISDAISSKTDGDFFAVNG